MQTLAQSIYQLLRVCFRFDGYSLQQRIARMLRTDSLIQRPSGLLSAAAGKVVHQLKNSLSVRNFRQSSESPLSPAQHEQAERQAKREQIKQKFEDVVEYYRRNPVLVEKHHSETYRAGNDHLNKKIPQRPARKSPIKEQPEQERGAQLHNQKGLRINTTVPENTTTPPTPPPKDPSPTMVDSASPTPSTSNDSADRFISLTATTRSTSATQSPLLDRANLTWNSALTTILTSARVDAALAAGIRARAPAHQASNEMGGGEQVYIDMRAVRMVPNFSYPLASANWHERCDLAEWEREKGRERDIGGEEIVSLCRELSPVSEGHGEDSGERKDIGSLVCKSSPALLGSGWAKAEEDLMRLLEPERVKLDRILSEVNPKFCGSK